MKNKLFNCALLILVSSLVVFFIPDAQGVVTFSRPTQEGEPTRLYIDIYIVDVDEIDSANQNFTANVFYRIYWKDPRLIHNEKGTKRYLLNEVWHPELQLVNQQKVWNTFSEYVMVYQDGTVLYRQRVWGQFSQKLRLQDFPFDQQVFNIHIVATGVLADEIEFVRAPEKISGIATELSLADWKITDWNVHSQTFELIKSKVFIPGYKFTFTAKRESNYFIIKIILPLILVVAMSWVVFWIDPAQAGTQISVAITAMLTLIAYRFAVGADLPKVSYLTRMDIFILGSTLIVFSNLVEVIITSTLAKKDKIKQAKRIDILCRVLFPLFFFLGAVYSFFL